MSKKENVEYLMKTAGQINPKDESIRIQYLSLDSNGNVIPPENIDKSVKVIYITANENNR